MANQILKVVTWNINGSHSPAKRRRCLAYLKGKNVDIAFIHPFDSIRNNEEEKRLGRKHSA